MSNPRTDFVFKVVMQNAAGATGNGTVFDAKGNGYNVLVAQVTGTFVGTVTFECSLDGTNWLALQGVNLTSGSAATTATAGSIFRFDIGGVRYVRARVSAYTSGAITVTGRAQA